MADKFKVGDLVQFTPSEDRLSASLYADNGIEPMAVALIVQLDGDGIPLAAFIAPLKYPVRYSGGSSSNCAYINEIDFTLLKAAEDE